MRTFVSSPVRVNALVGPTASGKSAVALVVAERAGAELISLDSMLVYRGLDIGVAKPTPEERARVPHHALDLVEPSEAFSVSDWLREAQRAQRAIEERGRRALYVGGTAFYLKALLQGLFEGPPVEPQVRERLEQRYQSEGPAALHAELQRVDPALALRIHANDRKRVVRALEVFEQTGRPLSQWQTTWGWHGAAPSAAGEVRLVGLSTPVEQLDARIAARTRAMLASGWVEEARAIRARCGFGPTAAAALGYAQVLELADGRIDRESCERAIVLKTRQFARKQRTWLRKFEGLTWIETLQPGSASSAPSGSTENSAHEKNLAGLADEVLEQLGWA